MIRDITVLVLLWTSLVPFSGCVEEYQREIFLAPRNFNPHPYEAQLAKIQDPGPVLFPPTGAEDESAVNNRYNIITVDAARTKHPVDNNPYSKVTEKIKYLISRKYGSSRTNQIDTELFDALAQQGAKVLNYSPQELNNYRDNSLLKKNYAFAYKVIDKATGDDFSHQQIRSAKSTDGEYRVKLPDGRLQIVSYKADKNGYKADVRYEVDPEATHQQIIHSPVVPKAYQYVPQKVDINKIPVRQITPRGRAKAVNSYDFIAEEGGQQLISPLRDPNVVILEQAGPTQIPVKYVDIPVSTTPSSGYLIGGGPVDHRVQAQYNPNVHIYTTNPRDHLQGSYIPTTAATPSYEKQVVRYTATPVPPTVHAQIVHNGDNGLYNPILSSTYAPPVAPPGHRNVINTVVPSNNPNDAYRQTLEQENELPEGIYIVGKSGKR